VPIETSPPPPDTSEPAVPVTGERTLPASEPAVEETSPIASATGCSSGAEGNPGAAGCEGREAERGVTVPPECDLSVEEGCDGVLGLVTFGAEGTLTCGTVTVGVCVVIDPAEGRGEEPEEGLVSGPVGVVTVTPPTPGKVAVSAPAWPAPPSNPPASAPTVATVRNRLRFQSIVRPPGCEPTLVAGIMPAWP
jgi:hypothetical protein